MGAPTRDDVWLCIHLYEQRREPELRAAREWMIGFNPRSFGEIRDVVAGRKGDEANRFWRQATSYWEMISALLMSAGVSVECRELFASTTREFFLVYAKLAPYLAEYRATYKPNAFQHLEAFCRSLPDFESALAQSTKTLDAIRARVAQSKKISGRKTGGKKR